MKETKRSLFPHYKRVDLSEREEYRVYEFPNGESIKIDSPQLGTAFFFKLERGKDDEMLLHILSR